MVSHISIRLTWHDFGWNGRVCKNPRENVYCKGRYSYQGEKISEEQDVAFEAKNKCESWNKLKFVAPCCFSVNAFGNNYIKARIKPPDFLKEKTNELKWDMPPASVCTWPFEYIDEDNIGKKAKKKKAGTKHNVEDFFSALKRNQTLLFYYVNYSHPFNVHGEKRYLLVGVSRLKEVGEEIHWRYRKGDEKKKKMLHRGHG
ncbi:MAG: hypothetical protein ACFFCS_21850 [Candidatus Hodarchaeota archaeon]